MNLKVVFVVVFLSALAITSTNAGIPKCCIMVKNGKPPRGLFQKVEGWERQYSNGACNIDALVVFVKNRSLPYCLNHRWEKLLKKTTKHAKKLQKN